MSEDRVNGSVRKIRIWDRPTRIFHWVLAILFTICFMSGIRGHFDIHIPAGQALLVLVVARIVWGLVGSETSRLTRLLNSPRTIFAYLGKLFRREPDHLVGHNPIGALSVVAMLFLLLVQTGLGLFAADIDGIYEGPLSFLVDYETARQISGLHYQIADVLLVLIGLHIAAVLFHLIYKRENLITAMFTGYGRVRGNAREPRQAGDGRALLVLVLIAAAVIGGIELAGLLL